MLSEIGSLYAGQMGLTSVDPSQSLGRPSPSAEENEYSYILTSVQASLNKAITGSVILGRKIITALYHSIIMHNTMYHAVQISSAQTNKKVS